MGHTQALPPALPKRGRLGRRRERLAVERPRCDIPYDVDEARARKGLPRRKRKNPRSTCYELAIRIPEEYQSVLGRKKFARTVYAVNKREDLTGQARDFEDEQNARLEALLCQTKTRSPSPLMGVYEMEAAYLLLGRRCASDVICLGGNEPPDYRRTTHPGQKPEVVQGRLSLPGSLAGLACLTSRSASARFAPYTVCSRGHLGSKSGEPPYVGHAFSSSWLGL